MNFMTRLGVGGLNTAIIATSAGVLITCEDLLLHEEPSHRHGVMRRLARDQESKEETKTMRTKLTRILMLSGTVTLTNALGAATAGPNELVVAPQGGSPTKIVAKSSGDFGFDLYRTLARTHKGENLFFSPYSIATALTMAGEGARSQTAEEMGKVLHWPDGARRVGDDAQRIPFELARIHGGYAELNRLFNAGQSPEQQKLRARTTELIEAMKQVQKRINSARQERGTVGRRTGYLF